MKISARILFTLFLLILSIDVSSQALVKKADSLMKANDIPELGFVVMRSNEIIDTQLLGYHRSDLKNEKTKARISDYFHLGSNTKAITGFIAGYLVEHQQISWNTKLFDLFPDLKKQSDPFYVNLSLSDLLSHRSRIQPFTSGSEYLSLPLIKGNTAERRRQFSTYVLKLKPVEKTSDVYNYSNAGYSIAVMMLEKVSGKTWEELVEQVLHKELNLAYKFSWPNKDDEDQPWGHWEEKGKLISLPGNLKYNLELAEPGGDLSMSLLDYAKFVQFNLQGLLGAKNLLEPSTYNYLHFGQPDYAIGWGNVNTNKALFSEHLGSGGTYYSYTLIDKKNDLAIIIVANSGTNKTEEAISELTDMLLQA